MRLKTTTVRRVTALLKRKASWVKRSVSVVRLQRENRRLRHRLAAQAAQIVELRAQAADGYNAGIRATFQSVSTEAFTPATTPPEVNTLENSISATTSDELDVRLAAQRESVGLLSGVDTSRFASRNT